MSGGSVTIWWLIVSNLPRDKSDENGKVATGFGIRQLIGELDKGNLSGDEGVA